MSREADKLLNPPEKGYTTFMASYEFEGRSYCFELITRDHQEAQRRLGNIKINGRIDGLLGGEIPA